MKPTMALPANSKKIVYSTTDGRQRFPDIAQDIYGGKGVVGFDRYGRFLCAAVPLEAIMMLAGQTENVDQHTRERIEFAARKLIEKANDPNIALSDIETIDTKRTTARISGATKGVRKKKRSNVGSD